MKLNIMDTEKSVAVITPTTGKPELNQVIKSVNSQTYTNIKHYVVVDGPQHFKMTMKHIHDLERVIDTKNIRLSSLPENVGGGGFYGHRVYAAFPHLVNADYVIFLDEDNWFDTNHVETLVQTIKENNLDWAYSLRKVYIDDDFLDYDNCEAIGKWPIVWSDGTQYLVDTSAYCFKRNMIIQACHLWHWGWGADRRFFTIIKDAPFKFDTTGLHTLNYRLPDMDKAYGGDRDIFKKNNEIMKQKHNGEYPWQK